jgi:hypothetical protein
MKRLLLLTSCLSRASGAATFEVGNDVAGDTFLSWSHQGEGPDVGAFWGQEMWRRRHILSRLGRRSSRRREV